MHCRVQLFAAARDLAQSDALSVDVSPPVTAGAVLDAIARRCPNLAPLLPVCRLAVDQSFVTADAAIPPGVELALIPPVSGG